MIRFGRAVVEAWVLELRPLSSARCVTALRLAMLLSSFFSTCWLVFLIHANTKWCASFFYFFLKSWSTKWQHLFGLNLYIQFFCNISSILCSLNKIIPPYQNILQNIFLLSNVPINSNWFWKEVQYTIHKTVHLSQYETIQCIYPSVNNV
jgi:hypothetical protein